MQPVNRATLLGWEAGRGRRLRRQHGQRCMLLGPHVLNQPGLCKRPEHYLLIKPAPPCAPGLGGQDAYAAFEEAAGAASEGQRRVRLGPCAANPGFPGNSVQTSKYNIVTFLPIFLFTMFSRVAYLYFAAQVLLWRPALSS